MTRFGKAFCLLSSVALWQGCSSTSGNTDGSTDGSATQDGPADTGPFLSRGMNFYKITAVTVANDGCATKVAMIMTSNPEPFPVTYTAENQMMSVGRLVGLPLQPVFGSGTLAGSTGTLSRANDVTDLTCVWHQTDTSVFNLIANDTFTLDVTENQSQFTAGCGSPVPPACMSTFKLTFTKTPPPADAGA